MLWLILIVGGLLIMMGQHDRSEALFYYFRLKDRTDISVLRCVALAWRSTPITDM
jgi:hypothetical protein